MRIGLSLFVIALAPCVASATPYWVAYEGDDFPENEGWDHVEFGPPAVRTLANGWLRLDTLSSTQTADFYQIDRPGALDPEGGEEFVLEWAVRVLDVVGPYDLSVGVFSDDEWAVGFHIDEDSISSTFEDGVSAPLEVGQWHSFRFTTSDMRAYTLAIDGEPVIEGEFWLGLIESRVGWGDGVQGAASLSEWDYFRFGVVPEPGSFVLLLGCLLSCVRPRR